MEKKSRKTKFGMNDRQAEIKTRASFPFHKQRTSTNKKKHVKKQLDNIVELLVIINKDILAQYMYYGSNKIAITENSY